jgi:REP element-mobilizing transposase RayT
MRGIARNCSFDIWAVGGTVNHVHILLSIPPGRNLAEVARDLKANSSRHMNERKGGFAWQDGYGAISVSPSQVKAVRAYIANQEEHHRKRSFDEEYLALLNKAGMSYDRDHVLG